jgi:amino acid transporter
VLSTLKRLVVGKPLASSEEGHTRLPKKIALPVFASDAISSTAYATQEILIILVPAAGLAAYKHLVPLSVVVCILLAIVITSYRQTIRAYPGGGGTYIVSRENLGTNPSLVAGASILVDYVLTVAVSVTAGVAAIIAAFGGLAPYRVELCLGFIALMTLANLRGMKESGAIFAPPTYVYVVMLFALIGWGLFRVFSGDLDRLPVDQHALDELTGPNGASGLSLFVLLRAFSSGAVALTGVEAVADGVPAFKKPEPQNASRVLATMAVILGSATIGIATLTHHLGPIPEEKGDTLLSKLGEAVFGRGFLYFVLQFATFAILILAANTAYADFPRLSSIIARDEFLPHQFKNRGDRLVFSNGVVVLASLAAILVIGFGGVTTALIPLYAVGVFTGFTMSQAGMVVYQRRHRSPGWQRRMAVNLVGAIATGIVLVVVVVSKFTEGAWIPAIVIPLIVMMFKAIGRHYSGVKQEIAVPVGWKPKRRTHTMVVLVGSVNRGAMEAITYARSLAPDRIMAVSVVVDEEDQERISNQWALHGIPIELHLIHSPYRALTRPVLAFLDELDADNPDDVITVVIPEFVVTKWYTQLLHNQSALALKARLLFRRSTIVTSVPVLVDRGGLEQPAPSTPPVSGTRTADERVRSGGGEF